jgi:hypothetical protein
MESPSQKETRGTGPVKQKKMHWLIGRDSSLSPQNVLLLFKEILKPVWTNGIQLPNYQSNIGIIQRFQNKVLRDIVI